MASLSYKLAYLEAIRVWLKYKNYKGDKRKRIYLLLQERADSARDFLWDIKEFPNFLKISKLYEDEDITTYEDMVKRIFGKLEGTAEHDNAYYRARIAAIQKLQDSNPSIKKFLQNGFVPADRKNSFEKFIEDYIVDHVDNSPLTLTELMTYNTWYEQHPEKVAGTMVESSSFYFPVLVKGNKSDVEAMFKAALKEQEKKQKPEDDELELLELEAEALELGMETKNNNIMKALNGAETEHEKKIAQFIMEIGTADLNDEEEKIYEAFTATDGVKKIQISDLFGLFNILKVIAYNYEYGSKHILIKHYGVRQDNVTASEIVKIGEIIKSVAPHEDEEKKGRHIYELTKNNIRYRVVVDVNLKNKTGVLITFYTNRK